jgi:hypothetical protein
MKYCRLLSGRTKLTYVRYSLLYGHKYILLTHRWVYCLALSLILYLMLGTLACSVIHFSSLGLHFNNVTLIHHG